MTDFARLIGALAEGHVKFALIGGVAAVAHGAGRMTQDLDVLYDRSEENIGLVATALAPLNPYLRGAPPGLPFRLDEATIRRGLNFTLTTSAGDIDLFGEVTGGGTWENLQGHLDAIDLYGHRVKVLSLPMLIRVKRAAGRPKDWEAIAELEALLAERGDGA